MSRFRTHTLLASTTLLVGAALPLLRDYSSMPRPPAETHTFLSTKTPLVKAIEAAERETGGRAREAAFDEQGDVSVHVYTTAEHVIVQVDGQDGAVKSKQSQVLPGAPVSGNWTELPSGLKYYELVVGTGETPSGPSTKVKVHYTGWLNDGTKFDSSVDRGEPSQFKLNGVIKGWTEGVGSMKVGGKRKLVIPYELGFGLAGRPPVPPKAALVFDVELIEIVK